MVLPYKYNAMIGRFYWSFKKFCKMHTKVGYETKVKFMEAKHRPVIVHFNGPGVRPWEKLCGHPYTQVYIKELKNINPEYKRKMANGSMMINFAQYCKHKLIDRMECFVNK